MDADISPPHLKKIQINPTLFSPSGGSSKTHKNKTRKRKPRPEVNTEEVRAQLLKNIKERTNNIVKGRPSIPLSPASSSTSLPNTSPPLPNKPLSEYELSIQYMQERKTQLTKQKRSRNKPSLSPTTTTPSSDTVINSKDEKEMPPLLIHKSSQLSTSITPAPYKIDTAVPHGCLKGGLKKTYKNISAKTYLPNTHVQFANIEPNDLPDSSGITITYISDQNIGNAIPSLEPVDLTNSPEQSTIDDTLLDTNTKTVSLTTNSIQLPPDNSTTQPSHQSSDNIPELSPSKVYPTNIIDTSSNHSISGGGVGGSMPNITRTPSNNPRCHKVHKTYRLGKNPKSKIVSVFCKNVNMINGLKKMQTTIKNVSIPNMKRFLVKKSLISIGSTAPTDVIKHMYESCISSGDIVNHNDKVLLNNYLNDR